MFSLMGNCVSCVKKRREPKRIVTLAILGLDCAGKTTTTKGLLGEPLDNDIAPTVGFCSEKFTFAKCDITLFDLGGGKKIRGIWKNYFAEVFGVIYVVDSSAAERMEEAQNNFRELLEHPQVSGKPVLLLANKQDKQEALDEVDICEQLNLENIVNMNKCPCRIESCSATKGSGKKMDPNIRDGLHWLCAIISNQFDSLKTRIDRDMEAENERKKIEKAARLERVRKQKEERELKEAEERKRLGIKEEEESEGEDMIDGDPFKALDINELEKKEEKLKEKKKKKELLRKLEEESKVNLIKTSEDVDEVDYMRTPKTNRSYGLSSGTLSLKTTFEPDGDQRKVGDGDQDDIISPHSSRLRPVLPPLQQPLGTKFVEDSAIKKKKKKKLKPVVAETADIENETQLFESYGQKSLRSVSKIEMSTKDEDANDDPDLLSSQRSNCLDTDNIESVEVIPHTKKVRKKKKLKSVNGDDMHNNFELQDVSMLTVASKNLVSLDGAGIDEGDSTTDVRKMKKKKKVKKNQLAPSDDDNEKTPTHSAKGINSTQSYPWSSMERTMPNVENDIDNSLYRIDNFSQKWGLVEDLPEVVEQPKCRGPNMDDDDDLLL